MKSCKQRFWYRFCCMFPPTYLPSSLARLIDSLFKFGLRSIRRLYPLIVGSQVAKFMLTHYMGDPPEAVEGFTPQPGQIVVDIGAHVGTYTILAANMVKSGKVIAIEAHLDNYRMLLRNLMLNALKNVIPVNVAVFNREGRVKLYSGKTSGWHSVMCDRHHYLRSDYLIVPCTTLDRLLSKLSVRRVDWIKIDVEGAELDVLKGMSTTLRDNHQLNLLIELHSRPAETIAYLESFGFDLRVLRVCGNGRQHVHARRK